MGQRLSTPLHSSSSFINSREIAFWIGKWGILLNQTQEARPLGAADFLTSGDLWGFLPWS